MRAKADAGFEASIRDVKYGSQGIIVVGVHRFVRRNVDVPIYEKRFVKKASGAKLFGVTLAARELNRCEDTVRRLVAEGRLRCIRDRAGRRLFTDRDLERFRERELRAAG
jgi:hypothetical protein